MVFIHKVYFRVEKSTEMGLRYPVMDYSSEEVNHTTKPSISHHTRYTTKIIVVLYLEILSH